jgi:uncharacterized RDD family membrane protein YckC
VGEDATAEDAAAGLPRIVAACAYDALLSVAIVFVTAAAAVGWNGGEAIPAGDIGLRVLLLAAAFPYYGVCWVRGGQTLGMRTWRMRLVQVDGSPVRAWQAVVRYLVALVSISTFGLGFLWVVLERRQRSWHDLASGTRLVVVTRASA